MISSVSDHKCFRSLLPLGKCTKQFPFLALCTSLTRVHNGVIIIIMTIDRNPLLNPLLKNCSRKQLNEIPSLASEPKNGFFC